MEALRRSLGAISVVFHNREMRMLQLAWAAAHRRWLVDPDREPDGHPPPAVRRNGGRPQV